ncbi:MAG TPA: DinB family protein [Pyrinomonadaceae bacterium]
MEEFINEFRTTIETATKRLERITEQNSSLPLTEGKWSAKEIIGHLIDSAANNHGRFVRAQLGDDLVFPGYKQNEWVAVQKYNEEPWAQLVSLWRYYNLHLSHVISATRGDLRGSQRRSHNLHEIAFRAIAEDQPATLEYLMRDYLVHLQHHLDQIFAGVDRN